MNDFRDLIEQKDWTALEEAWMAIVEGAGEEGGAELPPLANFLAAAEAMIVGSEKAKADVLIDLTLPLYRDRAPGEEILELMRLRCLASPDDSSLRENYVQAFLEHHGSTSIEAEFLKLSDLERSPDISRSFTALDHWMSFRPGKYVFHPSGWGAGKIESVDPLLKQGTVNLEKKPHHRMSIEAMGSVLQPVPEDHFLVLKYEGGDGIRQRIEEDPVDIFRVILDSFRNPMPLKDIKEHISPEYIPTKSWSKWWTKAKKLLRGDGHFRIGDRSPYIVEKLEAEISYEDELLRSFKSETWPKRRTLAKKVLKDGGKEFPRLHEEIQREFSRKAAESTDSEALGAACLLEVHELVPEGEDSPVEAVLTRSDQTFELIRDLEGAEEQREAVQRTAQILPERYPDLAESLWMESSDAAREAILDTLEETGELTEALMGRAAAVIASPRQGPELFIWIAKKHLDGSLKEPVAPLVDELSPIQLINRILDLLDYLVLKNDREKTAEFAALLRTGRSLLVGKKQSFFEHAIRESDKRSIRDLYNRLLRSEGPNEQQRIELLDVMTKAVPELNRKEEKPVWEQEAIFTTQAGLSKHRAELREIMDERLPEVFEDIGRAAEFGDLRENAEYKAALEQRDFLTKKGEEMREEIDLAKLITPDMFKEDEVSLGAQITARQVSSGQEVQYKILGPWDGGPDEGILNYRSPMARFFLGAHVGETVSVELPGGTEDYEIIKIESGIDAGARPGSGES